MAISLAQSLGRDPLGFVEFEIGVPEELAGFLMVTVDSHALEGVGVAHLHEMSDLETLQPAFLLVVAFDLDEASGFLVDPHLHVTVSSTLPWVGNSQEPALSAPDLIRPHHDCLRPLQEAHRKILEGEIGPFNGLAKLGIRKGLRLPVDDLKEVEASVPVTDVKANRLPGFWLVVGELNVLAPQEEPHRDLDDVLSGLLPDLSSQALMLEGRQRTGGLEKIVGVRSLRGGLNTGEQE